MRILHTSDWHLGASLGGFSRLDEQRAVLGEICRLARDKHVDLVLLAGDVYDSFTPPAAAEQLFLDAMDMLAREKIACVVIAGNHDSPDRLCAPRAFAGTHGIYIVGLPGEIPQGEGILESAPNFLRIRPRGCGYDCAIAALPYPSMGRLGCEEDEYSARVGDMFRAADEHFKPEYVNLAVSHLFARGGKACGIERPIEGVGGALWYTHRAVACTIDGKVRELPIGLSVQEIVSRGYASPVSGNLVSICADGEIPDVLERGAGNPYTLCVNGEPVDVSTYKLREGDVLEFINGTDKTGDVTKQTTEIPCGIQVPDSSLLLASIGYVKQWGQNGISTVETGVVSGRTIDRGVTQEARDLIIANSGVNPDDGRRLVAITFDDGPNLDYTPQYLDILARYGAKATFFMLGSTLAAGEEYTQMAQRVRDAGHQIASHTYSHDDCTLSGMDAATREGEISQTFDLIEQATGVQTSVLRPPYGKLRGWQFLQYMADTGRDITMSVYWSVDSEDWSIASNGSGIEDGAAQIVANCTNGLSGDNYNGAIILMHDAGGNRDRDVVALPSIIERFQAEGYEFVTVNELVAADSTLPEWLSSGNATRPEGSIIPDTSGIY